MKALGICHAAEVGPLPHVMAGSLAVLTATGTPQARLEQCLDVAAQLGAFLPFAPGRAPSGAAACAWAQDAASSLLAALDRVAGQAEMIVTLTPPAPTRGSPTESGRDWLRARLERHADHRALADRLLTAAPEATMLSRQEPDARALSGRAPGGMIEAVLLLPPSEMAARAARLHAALTAPCPEEATCRITGPWPAFGLAARLCPGPGSQRAPVSPTVAA